MKSIILSIVSLLICINCYAAPVMLDYSGNFEPIIYIGEYMAGPKADQSCLVYTTQKSLDMMLNLYEYNGKDWYMDIFVEPRGKLREVTINNIKKNKITWLNTRSGSRFFWATEYRTLSKGNKLTLYSPEIYINDHGEFLGQCVIQDDVFDLSEYKGNFGMKALNNEVINFLNREFARRNNKNDGQPIK